MDALNFDNFTRRFGQAMTRRSIAGLLVALGLGGTTPGPRKAAAKKKKGKKKKKKNTCASGAVRCGGACVDTLTDEAHCGGCNQACESGQACAGGTCQSGGCPDDLDPCGGDCVDTQTDPSHCGSCGNGCNSETQTCQGGLCTDICASGERYCPNLDVCVPDDDPNRCCVAQDCGGALQNPFGDLICTAEGRCVCADPNEGRCSSATTPSRNFLCDVCCPGGGGCPQGQVCNIEGNILSCDCDLQNGWLQCFDGCTFVMGDDVLNCGACDNICCHTPESCAASGQMCDRGVCCTVNGTGCLSDSSCCSGLCENGTCKSCGNAEECNIGGQTCDGGRCCIASGGPCFGAQRTNACCTGQCNLQTLRCV